MSAERIFVVIIGIEEYSYSKAPHGMRGADFARNDAVEFKECSQKVFDVADENIQFWLDSDANRSRLENDLPCFLKGLGAEDTLIFYYAGHGFLEKDENRITAWDTHPDNLSQTSISLTKVLLDPLKQSNCKRALIFIDACPTLLNDSISSSGVLADMAKYEFEQFIQAKAHTAIYLSSSPGQSSYTSKTLKHGIWAFHLLEALRGNATEALSRDEWLTDLSLKDYLSFAIPEYIRKNTNITKKQQPYAIVSAGHAFKIVQIKKPEESLNWQSFNLEIAEAYLRSKDNGPIKSLPGFEKKRGHFIPDYHSSKVTEFVQRLLAEKIQSESKEVYDRAKSILKLKRKQISRNFYEVSANVDCELFRIEWKSEQNPQNPAEYLLTRIVKLRAQLPQLPDDFDEIFPVEPDEFVIPIRGKLNFDYIADQFEALSDEIDGTFDEDEDRGIVCIKSNEETWFTVNLQSNEFIVYPSRQPGCVMLLKAVSKEMAKLLAFSTNSFLIE